MTDVPTPHRDGPVVRQALGVAVGGLAAVGALVLWGADPRTPLPRAEAPPSAVTAAPVAPAQTSHSDVAAPAPSVTASTAPPRDAAIDERLTYPPCKPPDPVGLGSWSDYLPVGAGEMLVPQKGGHTDDFGYDVLLHFHGHEAVRKSVVRVSRGVVFVGVDLGNGSGAYSAAFPTRREFETLRSQIRDALRVQSGDARAHVRHLALSAWSAGYGAVTEILAHGADGIDAVVLLDGLHAAWKRGAVSSPHAEDLSDRTIRPVIEYARRALAGTGLFVFTHSEIEPPTYPGTGPTAELLLAALGVKRVSVDASDDPFGLLSRAEQGGVTVRGYRGVDAPAHCAQVAHIGPLLRDVIEARWQTPPLDRSVPQKGSPPRARPGAGRFKGPDSDGIELRFVGPRPAETPGAGFDTGGLEPIPLGNVDDPGAEP